MMRIYNIEPDVRVSKFSVRAIFENLGFSLRYCYVWFFSYFNNSVLSRNRLYFVIFMIIAVVCVITAIKLIIDKKIGRVLIVIFSMLALPLAMNILQIIYPSYGIRDILCYQYVLIIALLFIFHKHLAENPVNAIMKYITVAAVLLLYIGNVISGNCTAFMYKICYTHYEQQYTLALGMIYDLEGYTEYETTIVTGGTPSYDVYILNNPMIFRYAEHEGGPVFWSEPFGMTTCREYFFKDFLGTDPGVLTEAEYHEIVHSEEYAAMPVWPADGSVEMINGYAVVKFADDPPVYY